MSVMLLDNIYPKDLKHLNIELIVQFNILVQFVRVSFQSEDSYGIVSYCTFIIAICGARLCFFFSGSYFFCVSTSSFQKNINKQTIIHCWKYLVYLISYA